MLEKAAEHDTDAVTIHLGPVLRRMSANDFFELCQLNRELRIERTKDGDLVIMPPAGGQTGHFNFVLTGAFSAWVEADGTGVGFDSSAGFTLPNGACRSPDCAWVRRTRWEVLSKDEREKFPPLCPEFVVEIRSPSERLQTLQAKMEEYIANGAQLGWLIDPLSRKVHVYRPGPSAICLDDPETLAGDPVLPGFVLHVRRLWDPAG